MISIADALNDIIKSYPLIEDGLSRGLINYSAFAREVKPQIEKRLYKDIKEGAIVMALKRISERLSRKTTERQSLDLTDLTVRSNLSELTFLNSETLPEKTRKLFNDVAGQRDIVCTLSEGIRETTYIVSSEIVSNVKRIFQGETLVSEIKDLSSVTIHLPKEVVYIPGVYYQILKMLAWENINAIEVLSTFTELTIVLENKDVDRAFSVLKSLSTI